MKKQLLLLCCLLSFSISQSQTFNDGVLEYTVTSGTDVSVKKYNNVCPIGALTIPSTVVDSGTTYTITSIKNNAFISCNGLTSVSIPNSVTSIGDAAFQYCSSLTSLTIPNSVTNIGNRTFEFCSGLTNLTLSNSLINTGDYTFQGCYNLTSLVLPNSVTNIGVSAFNSCIGLTSLTLSNSLITIGDSAFSDCSLTNLNIPNSVTDIQFGAFDHCNNLTSVTVNWTTPLVVSPPLFYGVPINTIPLTVPVGTEALYQNAAVWQDFYYVLTTEDFTENNIKVQLYPNPMQNQMNITLSNNLTLKEILIYNNLGQLIKKSTVSSINMTDLQGVYFAQIITDKGKVTKKIIVE